MVELDGGPGGRTLLLPFSRAAVPTVDLENGRLVVDPPAELDAGQDDAHES